ncbi:MAG TPA: putative dsRNA-binding protein, partial [Candidatus Megaira endosymbiont of Hartmannula sinica]|nr:putative dsRNA-binding protein [Candidatus Megaera endosymbiont of Hartmannula sinica]
GGRDNISNLEDVLESLIGAIYVDSNFTLDNAKKFIQRLWMQYIDNANSILADYKTKLQEWSQANGFNIPQYNILEKTGQAHNPIFKVEVIVSQYREKAQGNSIKEATKVAAKKMVISLSDAGIM